MKKVWSSCLVLAFALVSSLGVSQGNPVYAEDHKETQAEQTVNLVKNGTFDATLDTGEKWTGKSAVDWNTPWIAKGEKGKYKIQITDEANLLMEAESEMRAVVGQDIPVEPNQKYTFSVRIKTEKLDSKIGARVRIMSYDSNNKQLSPLWYSKSLVGDNDWTTITEEFVAGSEATKIRVELFFETGKGKVQFDDVSLTKKEEKKETQPQKTKEIDFDDSVTLTTDKRWGIDSKYTYKIKDTSVATIENGAIVPKKAGSTELVVSAPGSKDKVVPLKVLEPNATYENLLKKWDAMISGNDFYSTESSYMKEIFNINEKEVEGYLSSLLANDEKKIWDAVGDYSKSTNLTKTYRRVEQIAKSITNKNSKYYNDDKVIQVVKHSMKFMYDHYYNENTESKGNWWDYEIGAPRAINNILTIMNRYFSKEEIAKYLKPVSKMVPDPSKIMVSQNRGKTAVGGNLSDLGKVKIIEALLLEDDAKLERSIQAVSNVLALVYEGEGFHYDGSYVDHTNIAYTGAYGNVLIDGFSQLLPVIQASPYKISNDKLNVLYHWIHQGFLPLIYKGGLMDMTRGRSLSRKVQNDHYAAVEVLRGILRIAEASDQQEKAKLQGLVKDIVSSDDFYDTFKSLKSFYDVHLFESLMSNQMVEATPRDTYLKLYQAMDKVAYYNKEREFAFGISMYSNKIQNYEFMNKENAKGWYTSDGASYLYNDDLSHYSDDYWATVDPYKLAGITETNEARAKGSGMTTMDHSFVGSTALGNKYGTVAMDFQNWNKTLTAKKSWFILGDRIVFLGSDIKNSTDNEAYTVVDNRKIQRESRNRSASKNDYSVVADGREVPVSDADNKMQVKDLLLKSQNTQMNIGYKFLEPTTVNVKKENRKGTWKDINEGQSDEEVENSFISIVQPHDAANNKYAYVLYPNRSDKEFEEEKNNDDIQVVENSEKTQAVFDKTNQIYGVVKYDDSELTLEDGLVLKEKGIYTIKKEGNKLDIAFLNPEDSSAGLPALSTDKYELQNSTEPTVENKIRYYTYLVKKQTEETTQEQTQEQTQQSSSELTTESRSTEDSKDSNTTKEESLPATGVQNLEVYSLLGILLLTISIILYKKTFTKIKK